MHKVLVYEKAFLYLGALLLAACLGALLYASFVMGIHLPGRENEIDPAEIASTPPFDNPGVHQIGDDQYEVVMLSQIWTFQPSEIRIPAGSEVTFTATSTDVIHGLHVLDTRINMMLIPGQVTRNTYRFDEPREHLILCHEYCGPGHHNMFAKIIIE